MNKNILYRLYAAAFVGICLVPSVLMPVVRNDADKEKRTLAKLPSVKKEGKLNADFFDEFDNWFSDHFALRSTFVDLDGHLKATLLGTSNNPDVIVGREGWLYYGETADDFMNINTLSDRAIKNISHNLSLVDDYCRENGARFVFFTAPNKNSVYPEYMPYNYIETSAKDNYTMLAEALGDADFYLDMKAALKSAVSNIPLYHKTDTHWNNLGAYIGHAAIADKLGMEYCPSGTSWYTRDDRLGDLAVMIFPKVKANDTNVYNDYEFKYSYVGRFHGLDDIAINTANPEKDGKLLMFRDSYGEAILPYLAECFGEAKFSRAVPYDLTQVSGGTVVIEIVERNLGNLQKYAPVMPAPKAELPKDAARCTDGAEIHTEASGSFTHIYGELAEDAAVIYIAAGGETYIAFNCFEDKLLGRTGEFSDRGFSLYIPLDGSLTADDVTIFAAKE